MNTVTKDRTSWLENPLSALVRLNWETVLFSLILIVAVITRFYKLEPRVMSHDETSHAYFSWKLYDGQGYVHDPMMHGPLQFHLVALSFVLFGDSDTTARIPAALASIATVAFMWNYRRYLGRAGALVAALLFVISPYMLYYGRYVRNEASVALFGVMTLWAALRYFELGNKRYLLWLTAAIVLHFTAKETSYIYTAQLLLFLGLVFVVRLLRRTWPNPGARSGFVFSLGAGILLAVVAVVVKTFTGKGTTLASVDGTSTASTSAGGGISIPVVLLILAGVAFLAAIYYLILGQQRLKFDLQPQDLLLALSAVPGLLGVTVLYGYLFLRHGGMIDRLSRVIVESNVSDRLAALPSAVLLVLPAVLPAVGLYFVGRRLGHWIGQIWPLGRERSLDLLMLVGTLILPGLSAFLLSPFGKGVDFSLGGLTKMAVIVIPMLALSIGVGLGWNREVWAWNAILFYCVFVLLYTTFFTNPAGFLTGIVGSLGYWIEQQGVQRGIPVLYYYVLIQIPLYEYLPALGSLLAFGYAIHSWRKKKPAVVVENTTPLEETSPQPASAGKRSTSGFQQPPVIELLIFWALSGAAAFSYAGEKMPWLTVHVVLPLILLAGWAIGRLIETTNWREFFAQRGVVALLLLPVFITSLMGVFRSIFGPTPPFSGGNLANWESTGSLILSLLSAIASGWGLYLLVQAWDPYQFLRISGLSVFAFLGAFTLRAAFAASYVNYDLASEMLVYAHSGPGVKLALAQIEDISQRLTGGKDIVVAYDDRTTYPFWWYLRDYPNFRYYADEPNRDLHEVPLILVGDTNFNKIEAIVKDDFYSFEYIRMWWPNQDYIGLSWKRIANLFTNSEMREALMQIWADRDFSLYGQVVQKESDVNLQTWNPSERFRLYIRKDVAKLLWGYSTSPVAEAAISLDPYEGKKVVLSAVFSYGTPGDAAGQFTSPHGLAVASDGSLYIADTNNSRIQHLSPDGTVLDVLGEYGDVSAGIGAAPAGTFKEPWDVAVGPDGSLYVVDTWNHRIQKFDSAGQPVTMWGKGTIINDPNDLLGFYGPRGIAVDSQGHVFVADTGNKRIVVFDSNGNPLTQFGEGGIDPGQFQEPVGIAVDADDNVYVADTWNQRVQVFQPNSDGSYTVLRNWEVSAWYGSTPTNYPYLAINAEGHVIVSDPDNHFIMEFTNTGEIVRYWGDYGTGAATFNTPSGVAVDAQGRVWVVDSGNGRVMGFVLP